jgi:hypothetical protein
VSLPITAHFGLDEFACHDGTPYPINCVDDEDPTGRTWLESRLKPLCDLLEAIRDEAGGHALTVNSGYRTPRYDERLHKAHPDTVAPADKSQHPKGRAADVVHATLSPMKLFNLILDMYSCGKLSQLGGIGLYPTFVHVDVRPKANGHLAIWGASRPTNIL